MVVRLSRALLEAAPENHAPSVFHQSGNNY